MKRQFHPLNVISGIFPTLSKKGLAPGTLLHTGKKRVEKVNIQLIEYSEKHFVEKEITDHSLPNKTKNTVQWININGLHDVNILNSIGKKYNLHNLLIEDILDTNGRPKLDEVDDKMLIIVKMLRNNESTNNLEIEQISILFEKGMVMSFQEQKGDVLDGVRERIRNGKTRIRTLEADYLAYALLDEIVDSYLDILQKIGEKLYSIETKLMENLENSTLEYIYSLKRELLVMQQAVLPLDEIVRHMQRTDFKVINKKNMKPFLGDLEDHAHQVCETIDTFLQMAAGLQDTYMSMVSNRMNEVMKTLTLMASIFIPLTFIAGVYGMNFQYMPELKWQFGYPAILGIMLMGAIGMVLYFKGKKWL